MNPRRIRQVLEGAACVAAPVLAAHEAAALAADAGGALVTQAAIFLVVAQGVWMLTLSGFIARWAPDPREGTRRGGRALLVGDRRSWAGGMFVAILVSAATSWIYQGYATAIGRMALAVAALLGMALVGILLNEFRSEEGR